MTTDRRSAFLDDLTDRSAGVRRDAMRLLAREPPEQIGAYGVALIGAIGVLAPICDDEARSDVATLSSLLARADFAALERAVRREAEGQPTIVARHWLATVVYDATPEIPGAIDAVARALDVAPVAGFRFPAYFPEGAVSIVHARAAAPLVERAAREIEAAFAEEPARAAEGVVILVERLGRAFEDGARPYPSGDVPVYVGPVSARVLAPLVEHLAGVEVAPELRRSWAERVARVLAEGDFGLLGPVGARFGEICGAAEIAGALADQLGAELARGRAGERYRTAEAFLVTCEQARASALRRAGRLDAVVAFASTSRAWPVRLQAVLALADAGRVDEAIAFAEASRGLTVVPAREEEIASICEALLLAAGRKDEAFERYAQVRLVSAREIEAIAARYERPVEEVYRRFVRRGRLLALYYDAGVALGLIDDALAIAEADPSLSAEQLLAPLRRRTIGPTATLTIALLAIGRVLDGHVGQRIHIDAAGEATPRGLTDEAFGLAARAAGELDRVASLREQVAARIAQGGDAFVVKVLQAHLARLASSPPPPPPPAPEAPTQPRPRRRVVR